LRDSISSPNAPQSEERKEQVWAFSAHLLTLSSFIGIPGFIGPLVVWLLRKDDMPFASDQAKEALNFQLTFYIAIVVSIILCVLLIGIAFLWVLSFIGIICPIIAAFKANGGTCYRYPMTLRFFK